MSRYLIEPEFPDGRVIPKDEGGAPCRSSQQAAHSHITEVRVLDPYFYN